jgi:ABC-type transporter Mla maintaining outer membrane lipid asymmetry ATPase subunit MlaF
MNQIVNSQRIQSGNEASTSLRQAALKAPSFISTLHPSLACHRPRYAAFRKPKVNQRLPFRPAASDQQDPDIENLFYPSSTSTPKTVLDSDDDRELDEHLDDDEEPDAIFKKNFASNANGASTSSTQLGSHSKTLEENKEEEGDIIIEFKDVHKSFGSKKILRGASFKIRRGEAVGIIGSSGTGKSTALRLAAGLLQPDSGEVLVKGEARQGLLSDDDTSDKLKVGLVFQSGALFDSLTVKQNVGFMLYEHSDLSEERIEAAVASSLSKVGLTGVENLYPSELSGGMKKRVALARAIVTDTGGSGDTDATGTNGGDYDTANGAEQLIMYDEPTAGLDPVASTVIEDLIRSMHDKPSTNTNTNSSMNSHTNGDANFNGGGENNGGGGGEPHVGYNHHVNATNGSGGGISSYVVVTHQHSTIRRAVDKIIFLHDGKVVWEGSVAEFDTTDEPIVRQFASGSLQGPIVYV